MLLTSLQGLRHVQKEAHHQHGVMPDVHWDLSPKHCNGAFTKQQIGNSDSASALRRDIACAKDNYWRKGVNFRAHVELTAYNKAGHITLPLKVTMSANDQNIRLTVDDRSPERVNR